MNSVKLQDKNQHTKSVLFIYKTRHSPENKLRKQSHNSIKNNTRVRNKFNKVKDFYTANYVTLIKKIKGDINKLKRDPVFMNWKN